MTVSTLIQIQAALKTVLHIVVSETRRYPRAGDETKSRNRHGGLR